MTITLIVCSCLYFLIIAPEHEIVGIFNNIRIAASPYAHRQV